MPKGRVTVYDKVLKQDLNYKETVLLSYTVKYPVFTESIIPKATVLACP